MNSTDRQFLETLRNDLLAIQRQLEERHDSARWPDLEAAVRLAWREAARNLKELGDAI